MRRPSSVEQILAAKGAAAPTQTHMPASRLTGQVPKVADQSAKLPKLRDAGVLTKGKIRGSKGEVPHLLAPHKRGTGNTRIPSSWFLDISKVLT